MTKTIIKKLKNYFNIIIMGLGFSLLSYTSAHAYHWLPDFDPYIAGGFTNSHKTMNQEFAIGTSVWLPVNEDEQRKGLRIGNLWPSIEYEYKTFKMKNNDGTTVKHNFNNINAKVETPILFNNHYLFGVYAKGGMGSGSNNASDYSWGTGLIYRYLSVGFRQTTILTKIPNVHKKQKIKDNAVELRLTLTMGTVRSWFHHDEDY